MSISLAAYLLPYSPEASFPDGMYIIVATRESAQLLRAELMRFRRSCRTSSDESQRRLCLKVGLSLPRMNASRRLCVFHAANVALKAGSLALFSHSTSSSPLRVIAAPSELPLIPSQLTENGNILLTTSVALYHPRSHPFPSPVSCRHYAPHQRQHFHSTNQHR